MATASMSKRCQSTPKGSSTHKPESAQPCGLPLETAQPCAGPSKPLPLRCRAPPSRLLTAFETTGLVNTRLATGECERAKAALLSHQHDVDSRLYREWEHRWHGGAAVGSGRLRRRAEQLARTADAQGFGGGVGTARAGSHTSRGRGSGRPRRGKRPTKGLPGGAGQELAGKPVLDASNYIAQRDGRIPGLYDGPPSSEVLQQHLPGAHVVKVFNNITSWHLLSLARPPGAADRSALPIAGNDPSAKAAVTKFVDEIGYDTVDAGPLDSGGRRFQFGSRSFVTPYGGLNQRGTPAGVAAIRDAIGAAAD